MYNSHQHIEVVLSVGSFYLKSEMKAFSEFKAVDNLNPIHRNNLRNNA